MTKRNELASIMGAQFRVWKGTPNADQVLSDTARALGYRLLKLSGENDELNMFEKLCRDFAARDFK